MSMSAIAARVAATLLTSEKGRKGVGFLLVAIFAPVILIAAILCSNTAGGADHNNSAVEASFYGVTYSEDVPDEFRTHIADMQTAFSFLDSAVAEANATMTDGNRLDPIQVKAIFLYKENHRQCRWFQKALAMPRINIRAKRGKVTKTDGEEIYGFRKCKKRCPTAISNSSRALHASDTKSTSL